MPGKARVVAYNAYGTLLAIGCEDGSVGVWDCDTAGEARRAVPHGAGGGGGAGAGAGAGAMTSATAAAGPSRVDPAAPSGVSCLAWSPCGRYIASGGCDRTVCLVEVRTGRVVGRSPALGGPVAGVSFVGPVADLALGGRGAAGRVLPPRASTLVACFPAGEPCVVDLETGAVTPLPAVSLEGGDDGGGGGGGGGGPAGAHAVAAPALADPARGVIFLAQARGFITVLDGVTHRVLDVVRLPGGTRTVALALAAGGGGADRGGGPPSQAPRRPDRLLASCHDRALRLADLASVSVYEAARRGSGPGALTSPDATPGLDAQAVGRAGGPSCAAALKARSGPPGSLLRRASPLLVGGAELSQAVDRTAWRGASLSEDGGFVAAATQVWEREDKEKKERPAASNPSLALTPPPPPSPLRALSSSSHAPSSLSLVPRRARRLHLAGRHLCRRGPRPAGAAPGLRAGRGVAAAGQRRAGQHCCNLRRGLFMGPGFP